MCVFFLFFGDGTIYYILYTIFCYNIAHVIGDEVAHIYRLFDGFDFYFILRTGRFYSLDAVSMTFMFLTCTVYRPSSSLPSCYCCGCFVMMLMPSACQV